MKIVAVAPHHWYVQPLLALYITFGVGYCFIHGIGNARARELDKAVSSHTLFFYLTAFIWELGSIILTKMEVIGSQFFIIAVVFVVVFIYSLIGKKTDDKEMDSIINVAGIIAFIIAFIVFLINQCES